MRGHIVRELIKTIQASCHDENGVRSLDSPHINTCRYIVPRDVEYSCRGRGCSKQ